MLEVSAVDSVSLLQSTPALVGLSALMLCLGIGGTIAFRIRDLPGGFWLTG